MNPGGRQHDAEAAPENWVVIVYNDLNFSQLLAHAAMDTSEEVAGGEETDLSNYLYISVQSNSSIKYVNSVHTYVKISWWRLRMKTQTIIH